MMEDDNRVYVRIRGEWKMVSAGCELHETPPDGWPRISPNIEKYSEVIVWRGKVLKDRWNNYDRAEFLAGICDL